MYFYFLCQQGGISPPLGSECPPPLAETPEKMIKVPLKTNNTFNTTMMALFLLVIVSKRNKQTEKNMPFIAVSHKFI